MKHLSRALIAVILSVLTAATLPAQVFADSIPEYISDIRLWEGYSEESALYGYGIENYTILKYENGKVVNLNEKAGSDEEKAKGQIFVALGYKTTKNKDEAITDIALMNMKGGFSVHDYDMLMETNFKEQILPFIESFKTAIEEYRINYNSSNAANKKRAEYTHALLNKLIDDDTGKPLGDLLLNKTKYELGEEAYNALSAKEKKNHADIGTIIMQANGKATLALENAVTRAADTSENTWIDRMCEITYDDLLDETGLAPSKAVKEVAKTYDDEASTLLGMWSEFTEYLGGYDDAKTTIENYDDAAVSAAFKAYDEMADGLSDTEKAEIEKAYSEALEQYNQAALAAEKVAIYEKLETIEYGEGSMLEFFTQQKTDLEEDITLLYPMAAALSEGQKAGLEFVSLKELVSMAVGDPDKLNTDDISKLDAVSVFEGVDRGIYEKGGVGLTSDAERKNAAERPVENNDSKVQALLYSALAVGAVMTVTAIGLFTASYKAYRYASALDANIIQGTTQQLQRAFRMSTIINRLSISIPLITAVVFIVLTMYYYSELQKKYDVKFDAIPRYMVDVKDIVGYNSKGEKIVIKNQDAYYRAALCNRSEYISEYEVLGAAGDINGTVCRQWVALYFCKNKMQAPVLADSLKAVRGDETIPSGYATGIHMFGSDSAENFNNPLYVWNGSAPKIFVYYKTEDAGASAAGSSFTSGTVAISGLVGIAIGTLVTTLCLKASKKKKESKAEA